MGISDSAYYLKRWAMLCGKQHLLLKSHLSSGKVDLFLNVNAVCF